MKRLKKMLPVLLLFISGSISSPEVIASPLQAGVNFQFFYNELSPYGSWVSYPSYGYVWVPRHHVGFRPYYSGGHWAYTDMGWMWVSDYDWGWAPFHYGTWAYDPFYGWVWVPGYDWAPAWVQWGSYDGYYGWAPVGPGYSYGTAYYPPVDHWVFVHPRHMVASNWSNHAYVARNHRINLSDNTVISDPHRVSIINNRNNYNNRQYSAGPPRQEVERSAHTTLQPVGIREGNKPGRTEVNGNSMNVYRPRINKDDSPARPSKVEPMQKPNTAQSPSDKTGPRDGGNGQGKNLEVSPIPERKPDVNNPRQQHQNRVINPEPARKPSLDTRPVKQPERQPHQYPVGTQQQHENKIINPEPASKPSPGIRPERQSEQQPRQNPVNPQQQEEHVSPHQNQQPEQRHISTPPREVKPMRNPQQNFPKAPVERRQGNPPVAPSQGHQEAEPHERK